MTTLVGLAKDKSKLDECHFETIDFLISANKPITVEVPNLTLREIRLLEQQLPHKGTLNLGNIPKKDAIKFAKLYRYLPNFAVLEN